MISLYEFDKNDSNDKIKTEIAQFFDVSLDYLLGLTNKRVPYIKEEQFITLSDDISSEELTLICEFLEFIVFAEAK